MARVYYMTWVPARRGWMKEYRGKKYAVSCRQLGVAETKEESYQAANAWWQQKTGEIDAAGKASAEGVGAPQPPLLDALTALLGRRSKDLDPQTQPLHWFVSIPEDEALPRLPEVEALSRMLRWFLSAPGDAALPLFREAIGDAKAEQLKLAFQTLSGEAAPSDRCIKAHAERWVKTQQAQVAAGNLTPDRADNNRICLYHFRDFVGPDADVATLDEARLSSFYLFCMQKVEERLKGPHKKAGWSTDYAKKVFGTAKVFVRWLWEGNVVELPRNIDSRGFRFNAMAKKIQTWTTPEFKAAIQAARGKLKLALLLMANCGMTQVDVSNLRDDEVDWVAGRVTRKRSKTANCENVPVVCYQLWRSTFELLKQYRSGSERVLLTESGKPFVRKELVGGKLVKADGFASNYAHLKKKLRKSLPGFKRSLKQLRKLGATLLESHKDYGRFVSYFLGHSPRTVKDRHYAAPSQELFDGAVAWLGKQLGQRVGC